VGVKINIKKMAQERGIENPFALQAASGVNYAVCHRLWNESPKMISLDTISKLCAALECGTGDLLVYTPEAATATKPARKPVKTGKS
jgi:DNA-binding Xre family transcriptional regulator